MPNSYFLNLQTAQNTYHKSKMIVDGKGRLLIPLEWLLMCDPVAFIITGGLGSIGRAAAEILVEKGAYIVVSVLSSLFTTLLSVSTNSLDEHFCRPSTSSHPKMVKPKSRLLPNPINTFMNRLTSPTEPK